MVGEDTSGLELRMERNSVRDSSGGSSRGHVDSLATESK
jgi:hypothetical protein